MRQTPETMKELLVRVKDKLHLKSLVIALSAIVVFTTTYLLILPAFTLDKQEAADQGGIDVVAVETAVEADQEEAETEAEDQKADKEEVKAEDNKEEVKVDTKTETAKKSDNKNKADTTEKTDVKMLNSKTTIKADQARGDDFAVSAVVDADAKVPADVTLAAKELDKKTDDFDYDQYKADALKALKEDSSAVKDIKSIKFYDISLESESQNGSVEPEANVNVKIEYDNGMKVDNADNIRIVHFAAQSNGTEKPVVLDNTQNKVETTTNASGSKVTEASFDTDGFSKYAVAEVELNTEVTITNADGNDETYQVTVTYGEEAKIPEGSTLSVKEFEKGTEDYEYARNSVLADKKEKGEFVDIENFELAALDISILDPSGNEIEPAAAVKVDIKIKDLPGVSDLDEIKETLEIQHHVEVENGVVVEKVFEGKTEGSFNQDTDKSVAEQNAGKAVDPNSVKDEDFAVDKNEKIDLPALEASFETEAFSTYTISWGNRSYRIHYVDTNGNSLTPTRTPEFSNGYKFLIYDVKGYEYDSTHYGSRTGTAIKPLLANYGNDRVYLDNNNNWQYLRNDIYVVYKAKPTPTQGGTPQVDTDEQWPDEENPARKPQFTKASTNNGNGTNNISLTITGHEKPVEKSTPADVIVVFDVSGSMKSNMYGQYNDDWNGDQYTSWYPANEQRLALAKTAVNNMADTLLNGDNSDVRMALVSFSTTAQQVAITGATNGFTSNYTNFSRAVNGLSATGGTNWEQALQLANTLPVRENAATFVVFVTDGDPTFRVSRGNVSDSGLDLYSNGTYQYYRNNNVFGLGSDDYDDRNLNFAVNQVSAIDGANKNFYAIGISNDVTKVQNLTTEGGVAADHAFIASDNAAMQRAFNAITNSIKSKLGFGNVEVTDGITALTNAEMKVMQSVDPNSFKYYRYGGENNKYGNGYANKTEWTTREADGCAAASYSETDGAVHWDMGETFQLEDDVTYVVEFTVWPSQAAYDLVADLNNGLKSYNTLTDEEKAQVVEVTAPTETTTGTYALKTNTDEVEATYNRTTKTGDTVTVSDTTDITAEYHEGTLQNMSLDSDYITVKKEWHNALDSRVVDGITLTVTKDGAAYLDDVNLSENNNWTSDEQYISTGFITKTSDGRYNIRETGHNYTVTEPASFSYYWDLTADTYRPMVIDGDLTMLVKTNSPTGTEGSDYYVIDGQSYQVSTTTTPQLTASNDRRSNLNLKKMVTANTQAVDNVPNPDDVFTYTITVTDINGDAVWFSAQDKDGNTVLIDSYSANVTPEERDGSLTGSYSVPSGAEFSISIKAGWNVRFFNLPKGTTYSIQETGMADGYEFVKAETSAEVTNPKYADDFVATPGAVDRDTVTGTIDQPNNVYSTEYTNNWNPNNEIVIIKTDENDAKLAGAQFKLSKKSDDGWAQIATFTSKADAGETLKVGHGLYKLEETAAPVNYEMTDVVYFRVDTNSNTTTVTLTNEDGDEVDAEDLPTVYPDASATDNEVTVKNWPLTTAEATKAWENADGTTTAPTDATVVFTLYKDGTATDQTVTLDGTADTAPEGAGSAGYESEGWKATFVNLPKYKFVEGEAVEIVYTIAETTTYPGYTASTTDPVANGGTITNTQEETTANALKVWENADGSTTAPQGGQVTYTLYADGSATTYTVTLDGTVDTTAPTGTGGYESSAWKAEFVNLPKYQAGTTTEIVYTIAETTTYPGYTASTTEPVASGETIKNTQGATNTYAVKAWSNADGTTTPPENATVVFTLYADGTATDHTVTLDGTVDTAPTGAGGYESAAWTATFVKLPKSKIVNGQAVDIVYTIAETTGYPGYTASTTDPVGSGSTITNSQDSTSANALKAWVNADGTDTAPQGGNVTYTLYADRTATEYTVTLDGTADTAPEITGGYESEAWKAEFVNLPKYRVGTTTEIVYTIAETTTYPGYTASTTDPVASGETITNTQEDTDVNALKKWENADGSDTPPEGATVVFTLYADGEPTAYTATLDGTADETVPTTTGGYESAVWKAEFVKLPKYKVVAGEAEGETRTVEIVYTVKETTEYPGYTADPAEAVASEETITNKQRAIDVKARKAWLNADGSSTAPEGARVVFTLIADGTPTDKTVTLDGTVDNNGEATAWEATFSSLPQYKIVDGEAVEIVYTVSETTGYDGYELLHDKDHAHPVANNGTIYNQQNTFWVRFKKMDMATTPLAGAIFGFNDGSADINVTSGEDGIMATTATETAPSADKFELAVREEAYALREIKAPDGYLKLEDAVNVYVSPNAVKAMQGKKELAVSGTGSEADPYVVTIRNTDGTELPMTGGIGTTIFYILGSLLVIGCGIVLVSRRRMGSDK